MNDLKEKWMKEQLEKELQLELVETVDWNTHRLEELKRQLIGIPVEKDSSFSDDSVHGPRA